jgi:hypothetical protein
MAWNRDGIQHTTKLSSRYVRDNAKRQVRIADDRII